MTVTTPAAPPRARPHVALRRWLAGDPRWARPGLALLLVGTALLYLVGLGASGWANAFYSAAAQAGGQNWEAFLYGSSDAANAITVDKTPAFLWLMDASVRVFGLSPWSILVPQALCGVASVALLYASVRRWYPPAAALLAGAVLALTPVATLMFRFNNPDALLTLLLTGAAYATLRAVERAGVRWLVLAGALLGFGFLTKMMQAFLVVPALALAYLVAAPARPLRRVAHLLAAGAAMLIAGGWWVALVELVPAASRPYVGGTQHNSILELAFGYNGFGRLSGNESGGLGNTNQDAGWLRLFGSEMGGQISWLLPAALVALAAGLWLTRRAPRTDRTRAALLAWGGTLLITGLVISLSEGIIHPYYTVALAPAIAALVGIGAVRSWGRWTDAVRVAMLVVTVIWSYVLLSRATDWQPWLRYLVLFGGLLVAGLLVLARGGNRRAVVALGLAAALLGLAGPAGYSLATAATAQTGALPSAGPAGAGRGFGGGAPGGAGNAGPGGAGNAARGGGTAPGGGARPGGMPNGARPGGATGTGAPGGNARGGMMALLEAPTPSATLVRALSAGHGSYRWVAAVVGSNSAAGYQLGTGYPVLAVGGFNGTDAYPTLAQFRRYVATGDVHYFIGAAAMGSGASGSQAAQQIASWVAAHYTARTVGGVSLYDLTAR